MQTLPRPVIPEVSWGSFFGNVHAQAPDRYPFMGQWELTCRCNLKCVMCYTDVFNTPSRLRQELTTEEIFRIMDELHEAGTVELVFTGGEPLSRPDFMEIYERAHKLGFLITVFTNGTLVTEEIADRWTAHLPRSVEISLHGISGATFEGVTQISGSFARCLRAIELLVARGIPLVLKTVGLTMNRREILEIKEYVSSLGGSVEWRFGQYLRDDLEHTGLPYEFQISEEGLRELERRDPELWKAKEDEIEREAASRTICGGGKTKFHIDAYGQLQLCSNNRRKGYDLRTGSFRTGFYELFPGFPCPRREPEGACCSRCHPESANAAGSLK